VLSIIGSTIAARQSGNAHWLLLALVGLAFIALAFVVVASLVSH